MTRQICRMTVLAATAGLDVAFSNHFPLDKSKIEVPRDDVRNSKLLY